MKPFSLNRGFRIYFEDKEGFYYVSLVGRFINLVTKKGEEEDRVLKTSKNIQSRALHSRSTYKKKPNESVFFQKLSK